MDVYTLIFWAIAPPLLALVYYCRQVRPVPALPQLLLGFLLGGPVGLMALGLEWGFEFLAQSILPWQQITRSLLGAGLRQLLEIGPIEEGSKLAGVLLLLVGLRKWQPRSPSSSTILLCTIAVALGFTAEENLFYLFNGVASIFDRIIGVAVHAWFSAPWGYVLGLTLHRRHTLGLFFKRDWRELLIAWLNAVACHALVNTLSIAWRYDPPIQLLSYGLFPFFLWMAWRLNNLLRRSQNQPLPTLISGTTQPERYWQSGLVLFALLLGGNAIFGWFLLGRSFSSVSWSQLIATPDLLQFALSRFALNLIPAAIAWFIYRYLRHRGDRPQS
ncbi:MULTISPECIES: PrsW family glutamic-type intramembrane protease [Trichocoleus]|uniref:PrsW family intramembrane metalloprotease n=1 Tax=Trichocoleus desertorum GB2-A4 TaxID=2933944 RepID=A0ABV0JAJ6_9CYAN|nr:PrsW family glutamic-type intramembrane protease [Trichocoleus sp. FACHB-46]MBD1861504.1 PrsW family intramembrane metalloprotease [Trichocoleus sp. FACHB-46]